MSGAAFGLPKRALESLRRTVEHASHAIALSLILLALQSIFWTERVPLPLKLLIAAVPIATYLRPQGSLLFVAALVPFGQSLTTDVWSIHPVGLAEALILGFIAGCVARRWRSRSPRVPPQLPRPAWLFALVVAASALVQLLVASVWHDYPSTFAWRSLKFLTAQYLTTIQDPRIWVAPYRFASIGGFLLEGVALFVIVSRLCREHPPLARRLGRVVILAATGAAVLSYVEPVRAAWTAGDLERGLQTITSKRWAGFIPSVSTTGTFFVLPALMALGFAATEKGARIPWLLAALTMMGAMGLSRTRAPILAGVAVLMAGLVWSAGTRLRVRFPAWVAIGTGLVVLMVATVAVIRGDVPFLAQDIRQTLRNRTLLAQSALRIMEQRPVFGVGVGQYPTNYRQFRVAEVVEEYSDSTQDAHNYFLWLAAETGLVGLTAFLWLIGDALRRSWTRVRASPNDLRLLGVFGGVVALLITCLAGQPLGIPEVAFTFWIALGLAAGASVAVPNGSNDTITSYAADRWASRAGPIVLTVAVLVLIVSVPIRARVEIAHIDLTRVSYGFQRATGEPPGAEYRWTGPRATFFVRSDVREVRIPLRTPFRPERVGANQFEVDISLDGQLAERVSLEDTQWRRIWIPIPAGTAKRFHRFDLQVRPTWSPSAVYQGSRDKRVLGVLVGEIRTTAEEIGRP